MSMNQLLAKMRRIKAAQLASKEESKVPTTKPLEVVNQETKENLEETIQDGLAAIGLAPESPVLLGKADIGIDLFNPKQKLAVKLAGLGKSFCLIGCAGSGKTTTTRGVVTSLTDNNIIGKLAQGTTKVLRMGKPSVVVLSYTNQAVRNIKEALPLNFKQQCSTFHKLLEYTPVRDEIQVLDGDGTWTGEIRNSMHYEPIYGTEPNTGNGGGSFLPHIDVVIIEEGGSVPIDLWWTFMSALPNPDKTIFIFLGDLNQLPPVFGDGILGFKLLELPIVELTETYRNVGLVTKFAHRILEGKPILDKELETRWNTSDSSGTLTFRPFKTKNDVKIATPTLGAHFKKLVIKGEFDTDNDVLLIPFNKQLGTLTLNKWLNHGLDIRDNRTVYQVINGYLTLYFAVGDKVLYNKMYCKIKDIVPTEDYLGDLPMKESTFMDRWGRTTKDYEFRTKEEEMDVELHSIEAMMEQALEDITETTTIKCSHTFTLEALDEGLKDEFGKPALFFVNQVGAVTDMMHVLAMSVHKSQGSEFLKVWIILHHSHAVMFKRELLYTACTRARRDLEVFYSGQKTAHKIGGSPFVQGIITQEIEGDTVEKKLKYFRSKVRAQEVKEALAKGLPVPPTQIESNIARVEDYQDVTT